MLVLHFQRKPMQKLESDQTTVNHQQSIQQSDSKPNIYSPWPDATQRTGRIQERKILRITYIHATTDSRTMPGMKNTVLCKLYRLWKAFDGTHRESLWCILRHYGIPCKIVTIITILYEGSKTKVMWPTLNRRVWHQDWWKARVYAIPFLFCMTMDWVMKRTDIGVKIGIIWTFKDSLGDLDWLCRWHISACTQPHRHTK